MSDNVYDPEIGQRPRLEGCFGGVSAQHEAWCLRPLEPLSPLVSTSMWPFREEARRSARLRMIAVAAAIVAIVGAIWLVYRSLGPLTAIQTQHTKRTCWTSGKNPLCEERRLIQAELPLNSPEARWRCRSTCRPAASQVKYQVEIVEQPGKQTGEKTMNWNTMHNAARAGLAARAPEATHLHPTWGHFRERARGADSACRTEPNSASRRVWCWRAARASKSSRK
jgi:hypothetical protein